MPKIISKQKKKALARRKDYVKKMNAWRRNIPDSIKRGYVPRAGDGLLPASRKNRASKKLRSMQKELKQLSTI